MLSDYEFLRQAAALMRERAQSVHSGWWASRGRSAIARRIWDKPAVAHMESWHPAVALAVADWLEMYANQAELLGPGRLDVEAMRTARAYLLGGDA